MSENAFSNFKNYPVAVLGAGSLGSFYGGILAGAGCAVTLISRRAEHRAVISASGLTLRGPEGETVLRNIAAAPDLQNAAPPRLLLVLVKSCDTEKSLAQAAPYIPKDCAVLSLQNGLGNIEALERHVPAAQVLGGVSYVGANYLAPGVIRHAGLAQTFIGSPGGAATPKAQEAAALFSWAGLPCTLTDNFIGLVWTKLLVNVSTNAMGALTRLQNKHYDGSQAGLSIMRSVLDEAMTVARAKNIRLEAEDPLELARSILRRTGENRVSMLQDVLAGRKTEIEALNGAIVREAEAIGLNAPANAMISNLIRLLEKSYLPENGC